MRQFSLNLGPPAPVVPDLDELAQSEIPVHASEVIPEDALAKRTQSERNDARAVAVLKLKKPIEVAELYRRFEKEAL